MLYTYLPQAYLFGMAACRVPDFPLCHAAGGAGYGLSLHALIALQRYMARTESSSFLERVDRWAPYTYIWDLYMGRQVGARPARCDSAIDSRPAP